MAPVLVHWDRLPKACLLCHERCQTCQHGVEGITYTYMTVRCAVCRCSRYRGHLRLMLGASKSKSNAPSTDVPDVGARGQHCFAYHTVPPLTAGRLCLSIFGNVQFALCPAGCAGCYAVHQECQWQKKPRCRVPNSLYFLKRTDCVRGGGDIWLHWLGRRSRAESGRTLGSGSLKSRPATMISIPLHLCHC